MTITTGWEGRGGAWSIAWRLRSGADSFEGTTEQRGTEGLELSKEIKDRVSVPRTVVRQFFGMLSGAAVKEGRFECNSHASDDYPYVNIRSRRETGETVFIPDGIIPYGGVTSGKDTKVIPSEAFYEALALLEPYVGVEPPGVKVLRPRTVTEAPSDDAVTAVVTSYGRYSGRHEGVLPLQGTSGGVVVAGSSYRHIQTTTFIPCRLGESWGFFFELTGLPKDRPVSYRSEMHHPPIRQPDGTVLTRSVVRREIRPGAPSPEELWSFLEGYEYELAPGTWTRRVFIDNREVVSMTFEVLDPKAPADDGAEKRMEASQLLLGIQYSALSREAGRSSVPDRGVRIDAVFDGTPAARAGLRNGDVVLAFNDVPIESRPELHREIHEHAGQTVSLKILRGGASLVFRIPLNAKTEQQGP